MTRQLAGDKEEQSYQPALVEIEDALVPAFIIEKHTDGQLTVFVSSTQRRWPAPFIFFHPNGCIRWMCPCARLLSALRNGVLGRPRCVRRSDLARLSTRIP